MRRRSSRRTRRSLALVFALIFAPVAARPARAACVEFTSPPAITNQANDPRGVAAADLDGDGDLDGLSASASDNTVAWYENLASDGSSWTRQAISTAAAGAYAVSAADVDGDGNLDVLVAAFNAGGKIAWYENLAGDASSWTEHVVASSASGANSVFAADMDGDGNLDILATASNEDKVAWFENLAGDGSTWSEHVITTAADTAYGGGAADMDGDGDLDVLAAFYTDATILWYENVAADGSTWSEHAITTGANNGYQPDAGDVDGDGDLDVLTASYTGELTWHENLAGDGSTWTAHAISTAASGDRAVFVADLDDDGDLDVLSASFSSNRIAWHENDGTPAVGLWTLHTLSTAATNAFSVVAADLDGDGDPDALAGAAGIDSVLWYRNERLHGEALFAGTSTISTAGLFPVSVVAADVDGDGDADGLSAATSSHAIAWYENDGSGNGWTEGVISTGALNATAVFAADLDGDGDIDALSASKGDDKIAWYENLAGDGASWTPHEISTAANGAYAVSVADLDGDGDLDALSASSYGNEIAWYENTAGDASSWTKHVLSTAATNAKTVLAADIDGDGALDVVAGSFGAARVAWYENLEGTPPTFTLHTIATDFSDRWALFAADIDGDGSMDVVSASYSESTISWHENDGSGGGWARHFIATGVPGAYSVHAADLDLDGDLDVAAASIGNDTVAWYENDGSGEGWAVSLLSTSADRANTVSAADLDGDGDLDALSASANDNKIAWYPNLGTHVHDDGFDSDGATTACWSTSVPPVP